MTKTLNEYKQFVSNFSYEIFHIYGHWQEFYLKSDYKIYY